jgi:hypothetical protein
VNSRTRPALSRPRRRGRRPRRTQGSGNDGGPDRSADAPGVPDAADDVLASETSSSDASAETATTEGGGFILPSLNDACDGISGLTGQAVLDAMKSQYSATYTAPGKGGARTALTIHTQYTDGQVSCVPAYTADKAYSPGWVQVVVQIDFATADGVFNESFSTPLEMMKPTGSLTWNGVVPSTAIKGTYKPTLTGSTVDVAFQGTFTAATTSGYVFQEEGGGAGKTAGAGSWN